VRPVAEGDALYCAEPSYRTAAVGLAVYRVVKVTPRTVQVHREGDPGNWVSRGSRSGENAQEGQVATVHGRELYATRRDALAAQLVRARAACEQAAQNLVDAGEREAAIVAALEAES
jgi:hypothetical protein